MILQRKHSIMNSDIREKQNSYLLEINLPGFQKEDIKAYVEDGYLSISASSEKESSITEKQFIRRERFCGEYRRIFYIGKSVKQEDLKASYKHGVLRITIPKEDSKKVMERKTIAIA